LRLNQRAHFDHPSKIRVVDKLTGYLEFGCDCFLKYFLFKNILK
jgi:hypothetical protein